MPNFSKSSREEILRAIAQQPGVTSFTGWDQYGSPRIVSGEGRKSFDTAMQNPLYDEEIERAMVRDSAGLTPSALQQAMPYAMDMPSSALKYIPEIRQSPNGAQSSMSNALISALRKFGLNLPNR